MCLQQNGGWKKNCKIDPKEKKQWKIYSMWLERREVLSLQPPSGQKVWPVEAQNVRFSMRVCMCVPQLTFFSTKIEIYLFGRAVFGAHIFWQNKNVSTSALVRPGGGQTYALVGRWIWSLGTLKFRPTTQVTSQEADAEENCVVLMLRTTFVLLWTNERFIGGNNAIQTYLSNEFHLPGANTWNAKTHLKRAESV